MHVNTYMRSVVKNSLSALALTCSLRYLALMSTRFESSPVFLVAIVSSSRILSMYAGVIFLPSEVDAPW
jgi:hypothetical protein